MPRANRQDDWHRLEEWCSEVSQESTLSAFEAQDWCVADQQLLRSGSSADLECLIFEVVASSVNKQANAGGEEFATGDDVRRAIHQIVDVIEGFGSAG